MSNKKTISIRVMVVGLFMVMGGLIVGLAIGLDYYFSRDLAKTAAKIAFKTVSENISERVQILDNQSARLINELSRFDEMMKFPNFPQERHLLPLIGGAMEHTPNFSIYVGFETGDFFEMINLESDANVRVAFHAAPENRWVVIKIATVDGVRTKTMAYLDSAFRIQSVRNSPTTYDPRNRPWFKEALSSSKIIQTSPYLFDTLQAPGVTYAKSMDGGQRVVALNISMDGLSQFLHEQRLPPFGQAFLFDDKGNVIAQTLQTQILSQNENSSTIALTNEEKAFVLNNPVIKTSTGINLPPFNFPFPNDPNGYSVDLLNLLAKKTNLQVKYINEYSWSKQIELFQKGELDLLLSKQKSSINKKLGGLTNQYMFMPQVFAVKSGTPLPLSIDELEGKTIAVQQGGIADIYLKNKHPNVHRLHAKGFDALSAVSTGKAYAVIESEPVLRYLATTSFVGSIQIGEGLSELMHAENQGLCFLVRPEKAILASILNKALVGMTPQEKNYLELKWFGNKGYRDQIAASHDDVSSLQLLGIPTKEIENDRLQTVYFKGKKYLGYLARIESTYGSHEFLGLIMPADVALRPYMKKVRNSLLISFGFLILLTPLAWYITTFIINPINALALESNKVKQRHYEDVGRVKSNITEIRGMSRSLVSMASSIKAQEESLHELIDSFIQLMATAIDYKSPYTGGHCARVPELSIMLAKAANDCTDGVFSDFSLQTKDEWREFRTAAWLHDCGKVTTPEYVVDKATKLETLYNRIHEVRMRFEVLLRDAEITYLQGRINGEDEKDLAQALAAKRQEIQDDFAFIASCNEGEEFMCKEKVNRIKKIAQKTWIRHLDNRLGLGPQEIKRYGPPHPLPCEEPLLDDRPEHIINRTGKEGLGNAASRFAMEVPEHLYNLGEIYNLSISKGTLTPEERYKVNEHISITIQMLETLPFPKNMARIPEYAGAHHETLIGTGYPRKLKGDEIKLPSRIIAIADVFEALTASDRPYKKNKKLSEAIEIISKMVKNQQLDEDLFKLFLKSGVYMEYAKRFLDKSQIDDVNISKYLGDINS